MIQNLKEIDLGWEVAMAGPSSGLIQRVAGKYGIRTLIFCQDEFLPVSV